MRQLNKLKKKTLKKTYIWLGILVFLLLLFFIFIIINRGDGYERDYVSEYKIEQPPEVEDESLDTATSSMTDTMVSLLTWAIGIAIIATVIVPMVRLVRRVGLV